MLRRIALLVQISPRSAEAGSDVRLSDVDTLRDVPIDEGSFVLILENESTDTYARGQLRMLDDGATYPIQSNLALFERLTRLLARAGES